MKKIILSSFMLALSLTTFAQLPYGTKLTENLFDDPTVVISKTNKSDWSLGAIAFGTSVLNFVVTEENYCVIALPSEGLPKKLYFQYRSVGKGTLTFYQSTDHENWTGAWTKEVTSKIATAVQDSVELRSDTRYLKFYFNGYAVAYLSEISVSEKKELSVNINQITYADAKVDQPMDTKEVTVSWTNVVATVTSTNPAFIVSTQSIGQKSKENQQTKLFISYSHATFGVQEGEIIIEGDGLKSTIKVSGSTSRYPLVLTWTDAAGEYKTTDNLTLYAATDYGLPVYYKTSNPDIALVDSATHQIIVKCSGAVDITAYHPGDNKYEPSNQITKSYSFVKTDPTVAFTAEGIVYGQELSATKLTEKMGKIEGTIAFRDVPATTKLDAGTYNLYVVFTPANECIYNSVTRQVPIFVDKASQTIEWNQGVSTLYVDQTLRMTAQASSNLALTYAFTSCNITINGEELTGVEAGEVLVIAFQAGNNNYYPSTVAMQNFEVLPKEGPATAERQILANPSVEELEANGYKFYHNGEVYISYQGKVYTAEGKIVK